MLHVQTAQVTNDKAGGEVKVNLSLYFNCVIEHYAMKACRGVEV
jgi:hypothetical protein